MSKKVGNLSDYERAFITSNCNKMTVDEIAEELNRTPDTVQRFLMKKGLWVEPDLEQIEKENRLKVLLYKESFWPQLVKSYSDEEIEFFEEEWVRFSIQLAEDISHTEALFIKDWICNEIEKFRVQKKYKEAERQIRQLKESIIELEKSIMADPTDMPKLLESKSSLATMEAATASYITCMEKLHQHTKVFSQKIQADRAKRREVEASADTFWGYVEMLNDEKFKSEESYRIHLGKVAKDKAKDDLMGLTQFIDSTVDRCLLNEESVLLDDIEDKE